eukprot:215097-Pelagomonas_calceolata.AAC.2
MAADNFARLGILCIHASSPMTAAKGLACRSVMGGSSHAGPPRLLLERSRQQTVDCLYEVINKLGKEAVAAENRSLAAGSISRVSNETDATEVPPAQPQAQAPAQATENLVYAGQAAA